jgi:hypothetical protein
MAGGPHVASCADEAMLIVHALLPVGTPLHGVTAPARMVPPMMGDRCLTGRLTAPLDLSLMAPAGPAIACGRLAKEMLVVDLDNRLWTSTLYTLRSSPATLPPARPTRWQGVTDSCWGKHQSLVPQSEHAGHLGRDPIAGRGG